jgi:hypothetical protein
MRLSSPYVLMIPILQEIKLFLIILRFLLQKKTQSKVKTQKMQFPKHFPLNSIDIINKPSLQFLQIQDGLQVVCGITWTTAYVLYVKQSSKDKSYGMPIIALYVSLLPFDFILYSRVIWCEKSHSQ